ncbi:MAG: hypothetical protein ACFBSC_14995 [Microcoleaceae cyanobacterium]
MEVIFLSLLIGSLGVDAVLLGTWLRRYQGKLEAQFEEEEILTLYPPTKSQSATNDTIIPSANGSIIEPAWEYKIVRANRDLFRSPKVFQRLCQEEADMGWVLLEKLDDRRVRFKRQVDEDQSFETQSSQLDPYRSHYGSSLDFTSWLVKLAFLMAIILPAFFGFALVSLMMSNKTSASFRRVPRLDLSPDRTPDLELRSTPEDN